MLIKCPECNLQVSDKAITCPHCGYPLKTAKKTRSSSARMRLPNGFGQISEIKSGNLRNRFRAMVHVGFSEDGKPIAKILKPQGYFATYNEAYTALLEYHKDPRVFANNTTIKDLYPQWSEEYLSDKKSKHAEYVLKYAYNHCSEILNIPVQDIKVKHIKEVMDANSNAPAGSIAQIKNFLNQILDYCVMRELISRNPAREYAGRNKHIDKSHHKPFEDWEISTLWRHAGENIFVDMILIACYSGWRPGELCELECKNISDETMTGGKKTESGRNRTVPIHHKIQPLVRCYNGGQEYLFEIKRKPVLYGRYAKEFNKLMIEYQLSEGHKPHDTRVQFISSLKAAEVDEYLIKRLVGHSIQDITENIYTHRSIEQLREAVEKI